MIDEAMVRSALALSLVDGVGPTGFHARVAREGSACSALATVPQEQQHAAHAKAERYLELAHRIGARCVVIGQSDYPATLQLLPNAPPVLWVHGAPALANQRSVAIVGTRRASSGGLRFAHELGATCARAGIAVVSGLALGIDGAAHRGALEAGGTTIAVLGTGVDVPYPPRHRELQQRIATEGLLLSEVAPGERGHAGTFPQRNRIIAALAELTVVVEAGAASGALITARVADSLGRTICAVPGSVLAPECVGSNALMQAGAQIVCAPNDLLRELRIAEVDSAMPTLEGDAAECWHALGEGSADIVTLAARTAMDVRRVNVAMSALELHGLVEVDAAGIVRPCHAARAFA